MEVEREQGYRCLDCGLELNNASNVNDHINSEHNENYGGEFLYDDGIGETPGCERHGRVPCTDPECDPFGVLHAELLQAERGAE